jgi:uncharacterized membrane protein YphA (DoxX/SURF4 family)
MKILRNAARILLGITFVFSGFVKGVDPLGTTYKIIDYFTAFGTGWANSLAFSLSVLQALAEFGVGVALIVNYRMKISSWLALIFMAFFTPLTLKTRLQIAVALAMPLYLPTGKHFTRILS